MKRTICTVSLLLCLVLTVSSITGCSEKTRAFSTKALLYSSVNFKNELIDDGIVSENNKFSLTWNNKLKQVIFTDKQSSVEYSSMPTKLMQPQYDESGNTKMVNSQVRSPIIVYYEDPNTLTENSTFASTDAIDDGKIYTERIDNGLRVTYNFLMQQMSVSVDYIIYDNRFEISIDPTKVSDDGERRIVGIALAPFLCSLENDVENSYLFIPDGSGTIVKPFTIDTIGRQGSMRVYGDDLTINKYAVNSYTKQINMPVFGVKQGNNALCGIISSSAEQAYISWDIGSSNKNYSSVYAFFRIRGYDLVNKPAAFMGNYPQIQIYDDYISDKPLTVSFYALNGDNADYNGMAATYRDYLVEKKLLNKNENEELKAALRILGGQQTKSYTAGIPHTALTSLTSVKQAEQIAKYFSENVKGKLLLNLVGYGESGLDVGKVGGGFIISSKFGNKKQIRSLKNFCDSNNILLSMDFDIIGFNKNGSGYTKTNDGVKMLDGQTLYLKKYDNVTRNNVKDRYNLLSRACLEETSDKAINYINKNKFNAISFESLSHVAYSDYGVKGVGLCAGMTEQVSTLINKTKKSTKFIASAANDYAAGNADYVTEVPITSSGLDISYYDIPFYQMVFKGYIPMSSESVNLSANSNDVILKCIETGISPTFTLIYDYDTSIVTTDFSSLPVSSYKGNRKEIVSRINEISFINQKTANARIKRYIVLENGLRVTEFDNNVKIVVNYADTANSFEDKNISAKSYTVLEG